MKREPSIKLHGMAEGFWWKTVTLEVNILHQKTLL